MTETAKKYPSAVISLPTPSAIRFSLDHFLGRCHEESLDRVVITIEEDSVNQERTRRLNKKSQNTVVVDYKITYVGLDKNGDMGNFDKTVITTLAFRADDRQHQHPGMGLLEYTPQDHPWEVLRKEGIVHADYCAQHEFTLKWVKLYLHLPSQDAYEIPVYHTSPLMSCRFPDVRPSFKVVA